MNIYGEEAKRNIDELVSTLELTEAELSRVQTEYVTLNNLYVAEREKSVILAARVAELERLLAECQPKPRLALGTRCVPLVNGVPDRSVAGQRFGFDFIDSKVDGVLSFTRLFESGAATTYDPAIVPEGVTPIVSFAGSMGPRFNDYILSLPAGAGVCIMHEYERKFSSPQAAIDAHRAFAARVRTLRNDLVIWAISAAFQYRPSQKAGGATDWTIPNDCVDAYGIDTYRNGEGGVANAILPLQQLPEFNNWWNRVSPRLQDRKWAVTEYGRGHKDAEARNPAIAQQRIECMASDAQTIVDLGGSGLLVWLSDAGPSGGTEDKNWQLEITPELKQVFIDASKLELK